MRHWTLLHLANLLPGTPKYPILGLAGCICVILDKKLIQKTRQKEKTRCWFFQGNWFLMCVKTDALKIMIEQNFSKGLQEERIGAAWSSCSWMIERVMELQPWRNSEPFVIDLLFDRVTMKLTGTILLKLTWLSKVKKKKKRKTAYHKWNSETMEGFVLSSKPWIIRECFLCETFLNNKRQKCLGIQSMIKYPESLHSQLENVSRWLISGRKRLLNFHISTCFH